MRVIQEWGEKEEETKIHKTKEQNKTKEKPQNKNLNPTSHTTRKCHQTCQKTLMNIERLFGNNTESINGKPFAMTSKLFRKVF